MPAKLKLPISQTFDLPRTDTLLGNTGDGAEPTKVTVVQAGQGAHDKRMDLWAEFKRSFTDEGEVQVTQKVSPAEVRRLEVFLSMKDCNLLDTDGSQLFKFPLEWKSFVDSWSKLYPVIADEIHEKVLAVNPDWNGEAGEGK
jgi:hypothetical protein